MKIQSIKDLKQIIALCRKNGVSSIEIDGIKLSLSPIPGKGTQAPQLPDFSSDIPEASLKVPQYNGYQGDITETSLTSEAIQTDGLTPEQLMFYSSKPEPGQEEQVN